MLLHAHDLALRRYDKLLIRTVDTDVVVLAIAVMQELGRQVKLYIAFGTGKYFRYIAAHEIAHSLGPQKTKALPMFHALTDCDTVSSFVGHGKRTAWSTWNPLPQLTDALLQLSCMPSDIPVEAMLVIERFIILLYDRTSVCSDINKARQKLFVKRTNVKAIPPTKAALEQHVKRAVYQGGYVWGQLLIASPVLPSPTSWGWIKSDDGSFEPYWNILPEASEACYELVLCKCKKGCIRNCRCKKLTLECTALCNCEGQCIET